MGPNVTCRALVLKNGDPAQSMYIGNLNKQIWALIICIRPGPELLSSDRPTIYNHALGHRDRCIVSHNNITWNIQVNIYQVFCTALYTLPVKACAKLVSAGL